MIIPSLSLKYPKFTLTFNPIKKMTVTMFLDGRWTGGEIVKDDHFHANLLGITPEVHRFQHELTHHVVGINFYGKAYSEVLWQAAHKNEEPPTTNLEEEWLVTALQYVSLDKFDKSPKDRNDIAALNLLETKTNTLKLCSMIRTLTDAATGLTIKDY